MRAAELARIGAGVTGVAAEADCDRAAVEAGLRLLPFEGGRELKGLVYRRTICFRADVPAGERLFVKAHELGHWALGHGNMLYTPLTSAEMRVYANRDERDAMIFAFTFVCGNPISGHIGDRMREAAEDGVPLDCLMRGANAVSGLVAALG